LVSLGNRAVGTNYAVPGNVVRSVVQHSADETWCVRIDVAVASHVATRNASNARQDSLAARIGVNRLGSTRVRELRRVRPGTVLVPIAERFGRGGPCGEHEVLAVDGPSGLAIDNDWVGFAAREGVDEDHAAIAGLEAGVAPRREHHDHWPQ
jgi:hypothetical protein